MRTISATEARVHFGEVLDRVIKEDEPVYIARSGKPAAVLVSIDKFRDLQVHGERPDWEIALEEAHEIIHRHFPNGHMPDADDLIDGGRDDID